MTTTLTTASGSTYELDTDLSRIRRLHGSHEPTRRQGVDGVWKPFVEISAPTPGEPLVVVWAVTDQNVAQCLVTSPVTAIAASDHSAQ